jgi:hypothetical protein
MGKERLDDETIRDRLRSVADPVAFLINLFAHAPVGLSVWRPDGSVLLTNAAFIDLFGGDVPPGYNVFEDAQGCAGQSHSRRATIPPRAARSPTR